MKEQLLTVALNKALDFIAELEKPNKTGTQIIWAIQQRAKELRKEIARLLNP